MTTTVGLVCVTLSLASIACGADKPAEYPPMQTEERPVAPAASPPPTPAAKGDPALAEADPEDSDPAFAEGPVQSLGREEIRVLVKSLPLSVDAIRFDAIDKFLLLYAPFTANKALLRETRKAFREAHGYLNVPLSAFSLSSTLTGTAGLLKGPYPGRYLLAFFGALGVGVARTKDVIVDFNEQIRDQATGEERSFIWGQIGERPDDNTIASRNLESLAAMQQQVLRSARTCDGGGNNCRPTFPETQ